MIFKKSILQQYVWFCLIGFLGLFVDSGALFLLTERHLVGLPLMLGKAGSGIFAMIHNFFWNEFWTFRHQIHDRDAKSRLKRFMQFSLISGSGLLLACIGLWFLAKKLGVGVYLANVVVVILVSFWNFGLNLVFNWKQPPSQPADQSL